MVVLGGGAVSYERGTPVAGGREGERVSKNKDSERGGGAYV